MPPNYKLYTSLESFLILQCFLHRVANLSATASSTAALCLFKDGEPGWFGYCVPVIIAFIDICCLSHRVQFDRSYFFIFHKCLDHFVLIQTPHLHRYPFHFFGAIFIGPFQNYRHYQTTFIAEGKFIHILVAILFFFCII